MTTFKAWLGKQPRGTIARLVREVPVSHTTLWNLRKGGRVDSYDLACRLSAATGGAVTAATLCGERGKRS